jgi:hypothetical protein
LNFSDLNLALKYVEQKATIPLKYWYKNSVLLKEIKEQRKITEYFV